MKNCNYGNEGNCVGEGKMRVLGAFGDLSESIESRNGNGGLCCLFRVTSNLISISAQAKGSEIDNNLGMKKSSIDGKQYLYYL